MLKKRLGIEAIERSWNGYYSQLIDYFKISSSNLTIPDGCEKIGCCAFWECERLERVVIPESVEVLELYAFRGCNNLKEVVIPEGCERVGDWAFYGCYGLREVEIPDSVDWIGTGAFQGCLSATIILKKPENDFEEIGENVFTGCKYVKEETRS